MWKLKIGSQLTGFTVQPDEKWPDMWRVHTSTGKVSDMVNLTRAKDAAVIAAQQNRAFRPDMVDVYWHYGKRPTEAGRTR